VAAVEASVVVAGAVVDVSVGDPLVVATADVSVVLAVEARDVLTMFNNPNYYIGYDNAKIKDEVARADESDTTTYVAGMKNVVRTIVEDAASDTLFIFPNISVAKAGLSGIGANSVTEALSLAPIAWS
jgi:peptide/nickel transport system substrate-binding protein